MVRDADSGEGGIWNNIWNGCEEEEEEVMENEGDVYGRELVEKNVERQLSVNGDSVEKVQTVNEMSIDKECNSSGIIDNDILDFLKQNKCVTCGRVCENVHYLRRHLTTHSKERKFKCAYEGCDKSYKYKCDVKRHFSDVHEVVLMFKCKHSECKERFDCKTKAHSHERKCEFKKKFKCPNYGCKCILSSVSAFNKHKEMCAINRAKVIEEMKRLKQNHV